MLSDRSGRRVLEHSSYAIAKPQDKRPQARLRFPPGSSNHNHSSPAAAAFLFSENAVSGLGPNDFIFSVKSETT